MTKSSSPKHGLPLSSIPDHHRVYAKLDALKVLREVAYKPGPGTSSETSGTKDTSSGNGASAAAAVDSHSVDSQWPGFGAPAGRAEAWSYLLGPGCRLNAAGFDDSDWSPGEERISEIKKQVADTESTDTGEEKVNGINQSTEPNGPNGKASKKKGKKNGVSASDSANGSNTVTAAATTTPVSAQIHNLVFL